MKKGVLALVAALAVFVFAVSCRTFDRQEETLAPRRSAAEIRLDDINRQVSENPVRAIDLIGIYRRAFRAFGAEDEEDELVRLEKKATENLRTRMEEAVASGNWDDAASYSRSLVLLDKRPEDAVRELEFMLSGARENLESGDNLNAFLAASHVHAYRPLSFQDAMLFLERAVELRQRRAAARFFAAAEEAADREGVARTAIPASMREYALGSDSVANMLGGVATVIVDRGLRIERGRAFADRSSGSAFFIAPGLLVTNYHVISSEMDTTARVSSRMFIRMGDNTSPLIPARVVGWDRALDLALIRTEHRSEFVFSVVDRVIPQVGETIFAIGSPVGLEKTVTSGIVSSLSRRFLQIGDVIQIDAAVNPGNSGGPVVDTSGRLVGIVFAGLPQFQGLNFIIPAERLAAALPAMIQGGKAERPWIGMTVNETFFGAEIIYTAPNTPAALHRIPEGGMIRTINDRQVRTPQGLLIPALQDTIFSHRPGELVAIETQDTDGSTRRHLLMTVPRPNVPLLEAARMDSRERLAAPLFGMRLSPGTGRTWSSTFLVRQIIRGSTADEMGISEQDPITIRNFRIHEREGIVQMDISIRRRTMGGIEAFMPLFAWLDSPDTL